MQIRWALKASAVCATAVFVGACGGDMSGMPQPQPASSGSSSAGLPKHGAPTVDNPLDSSKIDSDACNALTKKQIESFAGKLEEKRTTQVDSKSEYCMRIFIDPATGFSLGDVSGGVNVEESANGLSTIYGQHKEGRLTTFKPIASINGYPAVIYSSGGEREGKCVLAVGLSDKRAYIANVDMDADHPQHKTPCAVAKKLAGYVVQNLKARQ